ncbi:serine/threonine-protein kinase unc-51-like isoform X2 [Homarus americanus]|uniref:serine/threonine-protein kinase unc-51-like isoform X2 n=1 Tax=Homarus americanus TaxID=6706 RepID=UPI001C452FD9|nr:serine/threonine-protein kinase unc-51-like isoform X2 [Homarus americanus]
MEVVGEYEYSTKDLIGHGAFAVVFKGRHKQSPALTVAIKSITKKNIAKSQNLLSKEIKILKELTELHHENVVALLDCKETANHVFLVMEYCNGGDLADYLQAKGTLSEDTIRLFLSQMAESMRALYGKGIVHRDLKPQNILLAHAGKPNPPPHLITLKIADFGFARFLQDGVMAATLCGSPMYMAPEVIMSIQYDAKADLWSLGTIVFQCLAGKAPFQAQTPQALKQFYEKNANLAPRIPSGTSAELVDLLMGLLKRNAKDRMDFETFFNHPFTRMGESSAQKPVSGSSSSVPMPTPSPTPAATPKPVSRGGAYTHHTQPAPSPPIGNLPPSPEELRMSIDQRSGNDLPSASPVAPTTVSKPTPVPRTTNAQLPEEAEDFVMVPAQLPNEPEASRVPQGWGARILTKPVGAIVYQKNAPQYSPLTPQIPSSPRPSHLPVQGGSSGSTHSSSSSESCRSGEPVPVPSQRATFHQMTSSGSSDQISATIQPESPKHQGMSTSRPSPPPRSQPINMRRVSDHKAPDVASLSPPAVQFTIGDPPMGGRRRSTSGSSYSTTPPTTVAVTGNTQVIQGGRLTPTNSPLRQSGRRTPPYMPPQLFSTPPVLPPILGSPTKIGLGQDNPAGDICGNTTNLPPTAPHRAITLPEMTSVSRDLFLECVARGASPPNPGRYGQSAPAFLLQSHPLSQGDGQDTVAFYAPPLHQETLMEREHNETLAKLNFVLALVDCILELARSRAAPITALRQNAAMRESMSGGSPRDSDGSTMASPPSEWQRRAEQLVLYVRALQLLSSALTLAKDEKSVSRLQPSNAVKNVVGVLNDRFRQALSVCKDLNSTGAVTAVDPRTSTVTADKLIYNYAIEMCQSAALDELFGKPEECFRRYQTAQILLHALAQQVAHDSDRSLLTRYKQAVERRLFLLHEQGVVHAYNTNEA